MSNNDLATVICVYKTGVVYTSEYVRRLMFSCIANGAKTFKCITDDPSVGDFCSTIELESDLPGWWAKLEMFRLTKGKYVYFDLDTIVHQRIDDFLKYNHKFTALRDFNKKVTRLASGILAFEGDYSYLYKNFDRSMIDAYTPAKGGKLGDQAYIEDHLKTDVQYVQDLFPGIVTSYKWNTEEEKKISSIVCYHGKPRPHETGWAI